MAIDVKLTNTPYGFDIENGYLNIGRMEVESYADENQDMVKVLNYYIQIFGTKEAKEKGAVPIAVQKFTIPYTGETDLFLTAYIHLKSIEDLKWYDMSIELKGDI